VNGCTTCGGFGNRHDPAAHGQEPERHNWQPWRYDTGRDQWWRDCADPNCDATEGRAGWFGQPNN
jgi:hypothetical protein